MLIADFSSDVGLFGIMAVFVLIWLGRAVGKAANTETGRAVSQTAAGHFLRWWFK